MAERGCLPGFACCCVVPILIVCPCRKEAHYGAFILLLGLAPGLIVTSALMIWKTLILVTGSESPVRVAVVLFTGICVHEVAYDCGCLFMLLGWAAARTRAGAWGQQVGGRRGALG